MYSFAQRKDTLVIDEPLYGHYLRVTKADHPGKDEVMASMDCDGEKVVREIILGDYEADVVFMKQMTHHLIGIDESFLEKITNVFLIRDPRLLIASFSKVIASPGMDDIGIRKQYELYKRLEQGGMRNAVIDSGTILENPALSLSNLCKAIEIEYDESMLSWKAGPRKEDGVWAKFWYEKVHASEGFGKSDHKPVQLNSELQLLADECMEYYRFMKEVEL